MSLYQCEKCGCMENTALGHFWSRNLIDWPPEFKDKKLCSECGPPTFPKSEKPTGYGKWHGRFEKLLLPHGMFVANAEGNLAHRHSGSTDVRKYALTPNAQVKRQAERSEGHA